MRAARVPTLLVVAVLALCWGCAPAPWGGEAPGELRVMTWNVLTARFDPPDWAATIAAWRPAVVGLQEICAGEAVALADLLREEHGLPYVAVPGPIRPIPVEDADPVNAALRRPCHDGAVVSYGLAVLTLLPVTSASTELFAPDHRDEQRGRQRVTVRAPAGGSLTVDNTHVGLAGVQSSQIRELAGRVAREPGPTVVLGDLNTAEETDPGALAPLRDGFAEAAGPRDEIDHVFVRGLVPVGPVAAPETSASDHRPLVATLRPP